MSPKSFLVVFLFLGCVFCSSARITSSDIDTLKSAWAQASRKPVEYARSLTTGLLDNVAKPIAQEVLMLLEDFLPAQAGHQLIALLHRTKALVYLPLFQTAVETAANIITKHLLPKAETIADMYNNKEELVRRNINLLLTIGMHLYHEVLEKSQPVLRKVMAKDFTMPEIAAVEKVLEDLAKIDEDLVKHILKNLI